MCKYIHAKVPTYYKHNKSFYPVANHPYENQMENIRPLFLDVFEVRKHKRERVAQSG
jgi:hypothetical protein